MLLHEAAAVLNLHAQAVSIQNIRSLIPTTLDINSDNYARWRDQFLLTAGKFNFRTTFCSTPGPRFPGLGSHGLRSPVLDH